MVDWMVEVLTNFKSHDQTFFLAVSLLDRYFHLCEKVCDVTELHLLGVTTMFIASKFEDLEPLKMKMVYDKISHRKLSIESIKKSELEVMKAIRYRIAAPTSFDFLRIYLRSVL